ncbi:MAG: Rpn family recombination-promoting nuclease/putative transposase [Candidatus Fibromonas sp.]|jgi:predicted transposase/invertase (TIGR01784 family)|nr:Rpn family recombination-promoting nuclease/putative transposase [Candidatus Fibromonas sp.]
MPKYIRFDYAAKRLLRQKANFVVLEGLLTVLLKTNVKIHRMLESESNQEHENDKFNRVDMLAELGSGELAIIEVQNSRVNDYFQRILYGTSKLITEYIDIGDDYTKVKKVYSVSIVYFGLGQGEDYAYHGKTEFRGVNKTDDVLRLSQKQQEQFKREFAGDLYPEYFLLRVDDFDNVAKNSLDEWLSFLKTGDIPKDFTAPGLPEARERLREDDMSETERLRYRSYMESLRNARSMLSASYEDGEAKGKIEGEAIGEARGLEKGKIEGIAEVAKNMKAKGFDVAMISKATGLAVEEIEKL